MRPLVLAAATLALLPATAGAATFGVDAAAAPGAPDCTNPTTPCRTINDAITQARAATNGPHTIRVAAGTYDETLTLDQAADTGLTISGAGAQPGGTELAPNAIPGSALVRVAAPAGGVTISDLRVAHLAGAPSDKNLFSADAPNTLLRAVVADVRRPASVGFAYALNDGPVTLDHADAIGVAQWNGSAVNAGPGSYDVTIRDARLAAGANQPALQLSTGVRAVVQRSVLQRPNATGVTVNAGGATLRAESSLVLGGHIGVQIGSSAAAAPGSATLRNLTVDAADVGVRAGASNDGTATIDLSSSIVLDALQSEDFQPTANASVSCHDSEVPLLAREKNGAFGAIACDAQGANATTSPEALFAAPGDYHLAASSPARDTGALAPLAADESATDLDGNTRVLDGDADCNARRDRGAYELTTGACAPAPTATAPPSNAFAFVGRQRFKHGRTVVRVRVPGPGMLRIRGALLARARVVVRSAGVVAVTVKPSKTGKRRLAKHRRLSTRARFAFTPTGGSERRATRRLQLRR